MKNAQTKFLTLIIYCSKGGDHWIAKVCFIYFYSYFHKNVQKRSPCKMYTKSFLTN